MYRDDLKNRVAKLEEDIKFNPLLNNIDFNKNIYESLTIADIKSYLPDDILCKVDRSSMANSLEVRSPFLNHEVANFSTSLPQNYKINKNNTKIKTSFLARTSVSATG